MFRSYQGKLYIGEGTHTNQVSRKLRSHPFTGTLLLLLILLRKHSDCGDCQR